MDGEDGWWTTSGNIRLPPLARVMGVGRQQHLDCPEVMGPCCLISEEEVAAAIKGFKMGKAAGPTGVVSEMMKASGVFDSRWMTDLINNIVKEGYIPDDYIPVQEVTFLPWTI